MEGNGQVAIGEGGMAMTTAGGGESVSLGTATQTHEVRMPMLTSTFVSLSTKRVLISHSLRIAQTYLTFCATEILL